MARTGLKRTFCLRDLKFNPHSYLFLGLTWIYIFYLTVYNLLSRFIYNVNSVSVSDGTLLGLAEVVDSGKAHTFPGLLLVLHYYSIISDCCQPFPREERKIPEGHALHTSCLSCPRTFASPASCSQ